MKVMIILAIFFFACNQCQCQLNPIDKFNKEKIKITKQGMKVLGAWGGANLIYSGIALSAATGSDNYFHRMNMIWGGVNFTLGTLGFLFTKNKDGADYGESMKKQIALEKIYLFNAGLDVAYVAGGFYFKEKAKNDIARHDRYKGYGNSIIMQGSALFLFDGIMYLIHQKHGKQLYKLSENIQVSLTGKGIGCIVKI